jgi:Holliday junction resolvase RusA-like endonuclease
MPTTTIEFFCPGVPKPAGSKRGFSRVGTSRVIIVDACKGSKDWKGDVKRFAADAYQGPLLTGPLYMRLQFTMPRPRSHYRTGKRAGELRDDAPVYCMKRPDTTKLIRAVEDALSGVIWVDDALVVHQYAEKIYGDNPGVAVLIEER